MKTDKFNYVSLLDSLVNILVLEAKVLQPHVNQSDDQLGDFYDGTLFKSHPMFSSDPHALQVVAYYDESESSRLLCEKTQAWVQCSISWQMLGHDIGLLLNQYSFLLLGNMKIL